MADFEPQRRKGRKDNFSFGIDGVTRFEKELLCVLSALSAAGG
jgi:hypothetical protein